MNSTIRVGVHLHDNTDIRVHDHLDSPAPFVSVDIDTSANLFVYSVSQAIELRDAAQHAVDAFVLAGEPVTA